MSDSLKHKIFTETDCISEQTMFDYIDEKLNAKESHSIEKHMLHCELCSDALEGLELTKNRERITSINQKISERIALPQKETRLIVFNYKLITSIAATVLLLIGGIFFFNQFNQKKEIAEFKSEPTPSLSSPPALNDDMILDSINSNHIKSSEEEVTIELKEKFTLDEKVAQEQAQVVAEKTSSEPDTKTSLATGTSATGGATSARSAIKQTENEQDYIAIPAESNYEKPNVDLRDLKKDSKLEEKQKQVAAEGASDNENIVFSPSSAIKPVAVSPGAGKKDKYTLEDGAKKAKNNNLFRSESVEDKTPDEISEIDIAAKVAYAPQSIVAGDGNEKSETFAESSSIQVRKEFVNSDQLAEFPGGNDSLIKFIHLNFKYPENFKKQRIKKNKIYVTFIVDKEGKIKDATIVKGINPELDKEALRLVNSMPKWNPGEIDGKPVSVNFNLPIKLE